MANRHSLSWLIGVLLVVGMGIYASQSDAWHAFRHLSPAQLIVVGLLQLLTLGACIWQWHMLLTKADGQISFLDCARVYLTGSFVESVTPSVKFGGEAAKLYLFRRWAGISAARLTGVLMAQKVTMMAPFFVLTALLLGTHWHLLPLSGGAWLLVMFLAVLGAFGVLALVRPPAVVKKTAFVHEAWQTSKTLAESQRRRLLGVSTVIWLTYPLKAQLLAVWGFGLDVPFSAMAVAVLGAYVAGMLPLLPGGLGAFEGTMTLVLVAAGLTAAEALLVALATRLFTFWLPLLLSGMAAASVIPAELRFPKKEMNHG